MFLRVKQINNFRDLGGIPTADGRRIAPNRLFRSAHHGKLSLRKGKKLFQRFGIRCVVDLRTDEERKFTPDTKVPFARYLHLPPLDDSMNPAVTPQNRMGILKRLMTHEEGTRGHLCDIYRFMMTDKKALSAFSSFLHLLIKDPKGGFLWHCTQGKDRAGMGTALLLMALGVDRDVIRSDYMRTNRYYWVKNRIIFAAVAVFKHSIRLARSLMDLMSARMEYINAAFDTIDSVYGDTKTFLHNALGLTDEDITSLRNAYLSEVSRSV